MWKEMRLGRHSGGRLFFNLTWCRSTTKIERRNCWGWNPYESKPIKQSVTNSGLTNAVELSRIWSKQPGARCFVVLPLGCPWCVPGFHLDTCHMLEWTQNPWMRPLLPQSSRRWLYGSIARAELLLPDMNQQSCSCYCQKCLLFVVMGRFGSQSHVQVIFSSLKQNLNICPHLTELGSSNTQNRVRRGGTNKIRMLWSTKSRNRIETRCCSTVRCPSK